MSWRDPFKLVGDPKGHLRLWFDESSLDMNKLFNEHGKELGESWSEDLYTLKARCGLCGNQNVKVTVDEENHTFSIHPDEPACFYPADTPLVTYLDVPSGKIIANDDLRPFFEHPEFHHEYLVQIPGVHPSFDWSVNCLFGQGIGHQMHRI